MPRKWTIWQIIKDVSEFNELKRNKDKETGLAKSYKDSNLGKYKKGGKL